MPADVYDGEDIALFQLRILFLENRLSAQFKMRVITFLIGNQRFKPIPRTHKVQSHLERILSAKRVSSSRQKKTFSVLQEIQPDI
ncbi:hypothetical protein WL90_03635 [Burkholderia cenocepacia]|nr:hypothetical protein WL90_03635 [Burkholderia cenocepacia]KWF49655.1 hypothetical protein WL89_29105 [Burkholderia cenocepacia]